MSPKHLNSSGGAPGTSTTVVVSPQVASLAAIGAALIHQLRNVVDRHLVQFFDGRLICEGCLVVSRYLSREVASWKVCVFGEGVVS